ncbi:MAG: hypothetical protein HY906_05560 [Deltaproteobacteria bacterium]|nr:hypothetical protein [Deltaproteobacteria bacterium]
MSKRRGAPGPAAEPGASVGARVATLLDAVLARFAAGRWQDEVVRAREEWLERAGRVYDDEGSYEHRVDTFHEWYALQRPLGDGPVPAARYLADEGGRLPAEDAASLRALCRSQWSLWQVIEVDGPAIALFDLLRGGRFDVDLDRDLPGLEAGDLFEARIIGLHGRLCFTRAFLFHPREASASIEAFLEAARRRGEGQEAILFRLAQVRLRCDRYRNLAADKVYEQALWPFTRARAR